MPDLTEEEIDDVLYLAQTNEHTELDQVVSDLAKKHECPKTKVIRTAVDPERGNTTLHVASANGHIDTLKLVHTLLTTSATPKSPANSPPQSLANAQNSSGNTPLHWACLNGHLPAVQYLVKGFGADTTVKNELGHTPIWIAENNGKEDIVAWLEKEMGIERDEEVNGEDGEVGDHGEGISETIRKLEKVRVEGQGSSRPVTEEDLGYGEGEERKSRE